MILSTRSNCLIDFLSLKNLGNDMSDKSRICNFTSVDWGPDEAKGDTKLLDYFFSFPDFESVKDGSYRYVIGRKGSGKTAIIERIRLEKEDDPLSFYSSLSLRSFPVQEFRHLKDKNYRDKSQFVSAWLLLLYVELAKLIVQDNGAEPRDAVSEIAGFLQINGFSGNIGFTDTVSTLRKTENKLKISAKWIEGESLSGAHVQSQATVHYQQVVDILCEKITSIESSSEYWIFMDELDEGHRAGDEGLRLLLLALLRAVEDSAISLKNVNFKYRPLLVLRSDIFDRLEDNDLNKLDDYILRLKWRAMDDDNVFSLRKVVDARIKASIPDIGEDAWQEIAVDDDDQLPGSVASLWSYLANRTYERPRDIIKFLKLCKRKAGKGLLTFDSVKAAEIDYSDWLYKEIRDEINSYLPCWRESLQCITRAGTGRINISDYQALLEKDIEVKKWLDENGKTFATITEILFDFGVIGNIDRKARWLFKYKDQDLAWNPDMDLIVHWGLHKKLRLYG